MKVLFTRSGHSKSALLRALLLSLTALSLAVSFWWVATTGFVSTDSLIYLKIGRLFFTANHALINAEFPPLFPLIISSIMSLGVSASLAAKILNAALFIGSTTLLYKTLALGSEIKRSHTVAIAALVMTAYVVVGIHTSLMTESLFLFLMFCNFYCLVRYKQQNTLVFVGLAAFFASLAALDRYAGVAIIASTVISAWLFTPKLDMQRMRNIALICAASSLLFALWLARNYWITSSLTGREFGELERESLGLLYYVDTICKLYFPSAIPMAVRQVGLSLILLFTLFTTVVVASRARRSHFHSVLQWSLITFALQSLLIFVTWFADKTLPLSPRILAPAYSLLLLMHFTAVAYWASLLPHSHLRRAVVTAYLIGYIALNSARVIVHSQEPHHNYDSPEWSESATILHWKSGEYESTYLISNGEDIMQYHLGREVEKMPFMFDPRTRKPRADFPQKMQAVICNLQRQQGYIVYLNNKAERTHLPTLPQLLGEYPLTIAIQFIDGVALKVDPARLTICE